jgi:hypothetical protein
MATATKASTANDFKDLCVDIYQNCESWDGSRTDAQETFDAIQDSIEQLYPEVVDEIADEEAADEEIADDE